MEFITVLVIIIAVALVFVIIGWFELRYLKNKMRNRVDAGAIKDDAYSSVATTKAVASSLAANGRDVLEAETIIYRAESAYERGDYAACKELADQARTALHHSRSKELTDLPAPPAPTNEEKRSSEVPAHQTRKMPANYLESKFIIETVESMLCTADMEARTEAEPHCLDSKKYFGEGDYTAALRSAMKARRILQGSPSPTEKKATAPTEVISLPKKAAEKKEEAVLPKCPHCGAVMGPEDEFCFACGKRPQAKVCPSCAREVSEGDEFCRKCGAKLEA